MKDVTGLSVSIKVHLHTLLEPQGAPLLKVCVSADIPYHYRCAFVCSCDCELC
jgi:hypothetical protein